MYVDEDTVVNDSRTYVGSTLTTNSFTEFPMDPPKLTERSIILGGDISSNTPGDSVWKLSGVPFF